MVYIQGVPHGVYTGCPTWCIYRVSHMVYIQGVPYGVYTGCPTANTKISLQKILSFFEYYVVSLALKLGDNILCYGTLCKKKNLSRKKQLIVCQEKKLLTVCQEKRLLIVCQEKKIQLVKKRISNSLQRKEQLKVCKENNN